MPLINTMGINPNFSGLSPCKGRLHTRYAPVRRSSAKSKLFPVTPRLACVRPAASVHPEPGELSSVLFLFVKIKITTPLRLFLLSNQPPDTKKPQSNHFDKSFAGCKDNYSFHSNKKKIEKKWFFFCGLLI